MITSTFRYARGAALKCQMPSPSIRPAAARAALLERVGARYLSPLASTAQATRAILLASATATTLAGRRASSLITQGYFSGRMRAVLTMAIACFVSSFSAQIGPILASRSSECQAECGDFENIAYPVELTGSPIALPQL